MRNTTNEPTSTRGDDHVDFTTIYIDAMFARITALEQRIAALESVVVLDLFSGDES